MSARRSRPSPAGLLWLALVLALGCGGDGGAPRRLNVLLISLDTTRADHIGERPGREATHRIVAPEGVIHELAACRT